MNSAAAAAVSANVVPPGMRIHDQDDTYVLASLGNILLNFWKKPPTIASIEKLDPQIRRRAAEHKAGIAFVTIALTNKAPDNSREINHRAAKILKEIGTLVAAFLFTDEGITGKLVKLSLNLTFMLSGANQRGFTSVGEVSDFLCSELAKANALETTRPQLTDAITRMISQLR